MAQDKKETKVAQGQEEIVSTKDIWTEQEVPANFYIPSLYKIIGVRMHCMFGFAMDVVVLVWFYIKFGISTVISYLTQQQQQLKKKEEEEEAERKDPNNPVNTAISGFIQFYTRWFYNPISDCFNRPIRGAAAKCIDVMPRRWTRDHGVDVLKVIPNAPTQRCINMGSYNYLGYGGPNESTTPYVCKTIRENGVIYPSTACEMGVPAEQRELERKIAEYIGKEDAIVVPMGYATNSLVLPALTGPGCLVISDNLNHSSLVSGLRSSGSVIRRGGHSDLKRMERLLREAVNETPKWKRILIVVEGVYSMEGEICPLPAILKLAKHYGAMVYVDEAHSIGALGRHGGGVCDYYGVNPADVDILMGTFTKSFGSVGGYVAASREVVAMLRRHTYAYIYGATLAPGCARQAIAALEEMQRPSGKKRIEQLRSNSVLIRKRLAAAGCKILGQYDSPVVPILIPHPAKLCVFSRECLRRGVATVVVGYPATEVFGLRARLCISAAFETREIEEVSDTIIDLARRIGINFNGPEKSEEKPLPEIDENSLAPCDFKSAPFVPEGYDANTSDREIRIIDLKNLPRHVLSGHDYLGLANTQKAIDASIATAEVYGCGSCGPRGFYGSTDKHLEIEERLRKWLDVEATILYSFGHLASTSVIPPFAEDPEDVLIYDESISFALRTGVRFSKCKRKYAFPHNNMAALASLMQSIRAEEDAAAVAAQSRIAKAFGRAPAPTQARRSRHVIVTEGVFAGSGDISPLPEIVELKKKFGYLLILDETYSLCTLGSTGLGARQYWAEKTGNNSLMTDKYAVDLLIGSLEPALGSVGGFCAGTRILIQHQILNGLGYVFSASAPPYLCTAACCAVDEMEDIPATKERCAKLHEAAKSMRESYRNILGELFDASGNCEATPMTFMSLRRSFVSPEMSESDEVKILEKIEDECWKKDVAVCVARFADVDEGKPAHPALRVCASSKYGKKDYDEAFETIAKVTREVLHL